MNNLKTRLFNRKASSAKSRSKEIITALSLKPGQKIADLGSGGGYFSLLFARSVGREGKVYAIDTNKELLNFVKSSSENNCFQNLVTINTENNRFPHINEKLDLIFLRNVYHHLPNREIYFRDRAKSLNPEAKIAIIDYNGRSKWNSYRLFCHSVPKQTIIKEMNAAGYHLLEDHTFLSEQSFLIFSVLKNEKNCSEKDYCCQIFL